MAAQGEVDGKAGTSVDDVKCLLPKGDNARARIAAVDVAGHFARGPSQKIEDKNTTCAKFPSTGRKVAQEVSPRVQSTPRKILRGDHVSGCGIERKNVGTDKRQALIEAFFSALFLCKI